eukprot:TRINITY_DN28524_c0_g1_i1.p2 TRINITY_DN28524_c0_g1~~TRINITY_DN28524_c0_g1_i1.p2  ORF type:complete len:164 (+),score=29.75 TRINITY_DN28524_c0_g1_i1:407-898(+)
MNMESPEAWARILSRASPDFIELKGATLAPIFDKVGLTMMNMPTHKEVKEFAEAVAELLPGYSLACEHEHSNGVLLAANRFRTNGSWRTWIDFEHFADHWTDESLCAEQYAAATPDWALYGSAEEGFAPTETRKIRGRSRPQYSSDKDVSRVPSHIAARALAP